MTQSNTMGEIKTRKIADDLTSVVSTINASAIHELNIHISTTSLNDPRRPQLVAIIATLDHILRNIKDVQTNLQTIRRELEPEDYHYNTITDTISLCNDAINKLENQNECPPHTDNRR